MRNLTITRRKSFVGCAMKDQVYIRDVQSYEIFIDGVPCRKIGSIKNGESKTFQIGNEEQQIFLIADKISKDYCNATITVPEGQEDVALSGVHQFVYGSNPFRFDGVVLSKEELAKQKRNNRKGVAIMIAASIVGFVIGLFLPGGFLGAEDALPKTFTKEEFQITLTDAFEPVEEPGYFAFYQSKSALVFALREEKTLFEDLTLDAYGELVREANGRTDVRLNHEEDFIWFEFTDTPDDQEIYYLAICCESDKDFWIVNFATPATNTDKYKDKFLSWAKSIEIN